MIQTLEQKLNLQKRTSHKWKRERIPCRQIRNKFLDIQKSMDPDNTSNPITAVTLFSFYNVLSRSLNLI